MPLRARSRGHNRGVAASQHRMGSAPDHRRHRRRWHSLTQHVGQQLQHSSKQQGLPILVVMMSCDTCAVVKPRPDRKSCWQPLQVRLAWPHDKFTATCSIDSNRALRKPDNDSPAEISSTVTGFTPNSPDGRLQAPRTRAVHSRARLSANGSPLGALSLQRVIRPGRQQPHMAASTTQQPAPQAVRVGTEDISLPGRHPEPQAFNSSSLAGTSPNSLQRSAGPCNSREPIHRGVHLQQPD